MEHVFGSWVMQMGGAPRAFYWHGASEGTVGTEESDVQLAALHVFGNQSSWLRMNCGDYP